MHASLLSECAKPEAYAFPWTEPTSEQLLVLSRLRTVGEMTEMAVNQWVRECLDFCTSSLATPRYKRKHPIKVPESRGLYIALDWIIFGSGVNPALYANLGRRSRNGRESIDT